MIKINKNKKGEGHLDFDIGDSVFAIIASVVIALMILIIPQFTGTTEASAEIKAVTYNSENSYMLNTYLNTPISGTGELIESELWTKDSISKPAAESENRFKDLIMMAEKGRSDKTGKTTEDYRNSLTEKTREFFDGNVAGDWELVITYPDGDVVRIGKSSGNTVAVSQSLPSITKYKHGKDITVSYLRPAK